MIFTENFSGENSSSLLPGFVLTIGAFLCEYNPAEILTADDTDFESGFSNLSPIFQSAFQMTLSRRLNILLSLTVKRQLPYQTYNLSIYKEITIGLNE
jgi:hypothetical protein